MRTLRLGLSLLTLVLLAGCIDLTITLDFRPNGSIRMVQDVALDKKFASMMTTGQSTGPKQHMEESVPELERAGATNVSVTEAERGEKRHYTLSFEAKDLATFQAVVEAMRRSGAGEASPTSEQQNFTLTRQPNGHLVFEQPLAPPKQDPQEGVSPEISQQMMASLFRDNYITYRITAPRIVQHNGTTIPKGVEWKISLADLMSGKVERTLRAEIATGGGLPPAIWVAIFGGALVVVGIVVAAARRRATA